MRIFVVILLFLSISAHAEQRVAGSAAPKIAVVDMQRLIDSSTAATDIKKQAKKEQDKYKAYIAKKEDALRKEEAKLVEERSLLSQEVFAKKSRDFQDKVIKMQRDFQEKRAAQETVIKKALNQVNKTIIDIVAKIAVAHQLDLVIPTSHILYATQQMDITDKALAELNMKLPNYDLANKKSNAKKQADKLNKKK